MRKLIPEVRFPEFSGEWEKTKFGKVIESNIYGPRFNSNDYSDIGNVKTIRGTDLGLDGEIKYDQVPLALLDEKMINTHKLLDGDLVMITTAECGATAVYRKQEIDYISSAYGVRLRLNKLGYPYYFKYFFQTKIAKSEINSYIRKSTIANLPGSDILRIKVNRPSLPEQTKIASFLTAVDEKLTALNQKKILLEQYKKGVMQQIFGRDAIHGVSVIRFKDDNGNDYADWEEKKLGEVCERIGDGLHGTPQYVEDSEIYFINGNNLNNGKIEIYETTKKVNAEIFSKNNKGLNNNTLLISINGTIGNIAKYNNEKVMLGKSVGYLKFKENINFYYFLLNTSIVKNFFISELTGSTIKNLSLKTLREANVFLPCLEEQTKIANFLSAIDVKINHCQEQIDQTTIWKKGLLQQMFV